MIHLELFKRLHTDPSVKTLMLWTEAAILGRSIQQHRDARVVNVSGHGPASSTYVRSGVKHPEGDLWDVSVVSPPMRLNGGQKEIVSQMFLLIVQ